MTPALDKAVLASLMSSKTIQTHSEPKHTQPQHVPKLSV